MRLIYMVAADVLRALGWEVEINEKDSYWNLVLTNTTSHEDMPESHKSCLRGLLRGWLMEFNYEGGRQQVNIYKELHGLDPEHDRYSCLDTCVNRTDSNTPQSELNDREVFVRRKDRFDRYVLEEPVSEDITTRLSTEQEAATRQTVFVGRSLLYALDCIFDDRVYLGVVLLHITLTQLEEATLSLLHQIVDIYGFIEGFGLDSTGKGDELSGQRLLGDDAGVVLDIGRRGHTRRNFRHIARTSHIFQIPLAGQLLSDRPYVDRRLMHG